MNVVALVGRTTDTPEVRYNQEGMAIARFSMAVDRESKDGGTDFPRCNAFGKTAEFIEKYIKKGMKIGITGNIRTGSYTNKDNQKVYTTDVIVNRIEFCEKKQEENAQPSSDGFMNIPDGLDEELPFH